jgi:uncharacterized protein YecE (DUF72 family)
MEVLAGTSGFSYKEWKGSFYPEDLPNGEMLAFYATRLPTVEINNTFYRMPRASVLEGWADKVGESFRFVLKASRRITHFKRLKSAEEETGLRAHGAALCIADAGDEAADIVSTAPWGYLRLRNEAYDDTMLESWARRIRDMGWERAFVFFKHEGAGTGALMAERLMACF